MHPEPVVRVVPRQLPPTTHQQIPRPRPGALGVIPSSLEELAVRMRAQEELLARAHQNQAAMETYVARLAREMGRSAR